MAVQQESVVTPERLAQGITWKEWMDKIERNKEKFQENYDQTTLDAGDVAKIKELMAKANGPVTTLALGEPWCTDVVRGLPVMARLAEETGLDLKIFFRDENLDIMNEFLYKGEYQSIPVFVFYSKDHQYLGHWIERSKKAREEIKTLLNPLTSKLREPELSEEERAKNMAEYEAFQNGPIWDSWRQSEVTELRELLEEHVK
jgi:thiol-disulfide isomerase/thioredoxin